MCNNIYESIGLKRTINASGRMTALGVSTINDEVARAMIQGGQSYVVIDDLFEKSGELLSEFTGAEASLITSSASAGIAISVAAVIAKDDMKDIRNLPDSTGLKNEVIIPKGHCVGFGAPISSMIKLGGGKVVEAGLVNQVAKADIINEINDNTAAIIYVKSHHTVQKGMIAINDIIEVAHQHNLPLIIDAAAEEDLHKYINLGADLVIYSGAKAFEGPTSGFITGKKELIHYAHLQYQGIGRPMKIGKEGIMGILKALEIYNNRNEREIVKKMHEDINYLISGLSDIDKIEVKEIQDEAGREIYRLEIKLLEGDAFNIDKQLKNGNPAIHCRSHRLNEKIITLDVRPLVADDKDIIIKRFKEILK